MELSSRPTSTYSNVEPSKDYSNYNQFGDKTFDKTFDKTQQFQNQPNLQSGLQQQNLLGSLPQQNQQLPPPSATSFNQNLPQQQPIHIPVQSSQPGSNLSSNVGSGIVQPHIVPQSLSSGHAPSVQVPTAVPSVPSSQQSGSGGLPTDSNIIGGTGLATSGPEYSNLISKLKTMIFGYESDYTNDPNFNAPLTLPSGIKTSITEIPEQLKKILLEKEPTFDRDLPTKEFFKDLPEREVIRHRVVHPVQVQTIMHNVIHPPRKIEIRHAAPHEVVHEVIHEIPHEIHHVVQHQVPFEVHHIVEHQVHDNVKHVLRHGVHQMVNHEIKEEVKHNILHGINKMTYRGPSESEISEDNKIPHSVSRSAPYISQSVTTKLLEDFGIGSNQQGMQQGMLQQPGGFATGDTLQQPGGGSSFGGGLQQPSGFATGDTLQQPGGGSSFGGSSMNLPKSGIQEGGYMGSKPEFSTGSTTHIPVNEGGVPFNRSSNVGSV